LHLQTLNFENQILKKDKVLFNLKIKIMKALKVTLLLALLFTALTSCTKQDLNEDDALISPSETEASYFTGGHVDD